MRCIGAWFAGILLLACQRQGEAPGPRYRAARPVQKEAYAFAVHPLHNPAALTAAYLPLMDHLNRRLPGCDFGLVASKDYGDFEAKIRSQAPAFILPNPWQALQAMDVGYEVFAMAGDPEDFKGLLIVRRDSGIRAPEDLRGRIISYPAPTALAACILPQAFLQARGLDVRREITHHYVGSQESSIMNVYLKLSAAGATWPPPWRAFQKSHPVEAQALRVLAETPHLLNNAVMARRDVPAPVRAQVREALLHLHETPEGLRVLEAMGTRRFHPAGNPDYLPVRRYIERFEREVRPVVQP